MARGRTTDITAEDRAAIVAAYRLIGSAKKVAAKTGVSNYAARKVLVEAGEMRSRERLADRREEVRSVLRPLWTGGATYRQMHLALAPLGFRHPTNEAINEAMKGIPRVPPTLGVRARRPSSAAVSDLLTHRAWIAGIFDLKGIVARSPMGKPYQIRISVGANEPLASQIVSLVGDGQVLAVPRKNRLATHTFALFRMSSVLDFLRAIEPFLRVKGGMVRRAIADLEGQDAGA